jgi:hypothetical protein
MTTTTTGPLSITDARLRRVLTGAALVARNNWRDACRRYAAAEAHRAAVAVRELWPDAATVLFNIDDPDVSLFQVLDPAGETLWAAGRNQFPQLDTDTETVITDALAAVFATDPDFFSWANLPGDDGVGGRRLDITPAIDEYDPTPDTVTFELLDKLLRRETAVLDPQDVDHLMETLRRRDTAHDAVHMWRWPTHDTPGGSWCRFSGQRIGNPADWDQSGNTRCPHDCPGSEAVETLLSE